MSAALHPLQIQALAVRAKFFPTMPAQVRRQLPPPPAPPRVTVDPLPPLPFAPARGPSCPVAFAREDGTYSFADLLVIAAYAGRITVADIKSVRRDIGVVRPRHVFCWLARRMGPMHLRSLPEIGRQIGNRDHTTALSAIRRVDEIVSAIEAPETDHPRSWADALLAATWPHGKHRVLSRRPEAGRAA